MPQGYLADQVLDELQAAHPGGGKAGLLLAEDARLVTTGKPVDDHLQGFSVHTVIVTQPISGESHLVPFSGAGHPPPRQGEVLGRPGLVEEAGLAHHLALSAVRGPVDAPDASPRAAVAEEGLHLRVYDQRDRGAAAHGTDRLPQFLQPPRVRHGDFSLPPHRHGLQPLAAHDRPQATRAAGVVIRQKAGEDDSVLPGDARGHHPGGPPQLALEDFPHLGGSLSP